MRRGPKMPTTTKQGRAYIRRHPWIVAVPAAEPCGSTLPCVEHGNPGAGPQDVLNLFLTC